MYGSSRSDTIQCRGGEIMRGVRIRMEWSVVDVGSVCRCLGFAFAVLAKSVLLWRSFVAR
jgi:hypothetical protein